jgi:TRAP-type C4-dicarboxylate transport system permease small subunit
MAPAPTLNLARNYLRRLLQLETAVLLVAFAILVAVTFTDVLLRRLTGSGLLWSRDVGIYANIWLSMIGIGIASAQGSHLRPHFLDGWVRPGWERWLRPLQEWLTALGFAALAWIAWSVVEEYAAGLRVRCQQTRHLRVAVRPAARRA